jgi:anthranilate synthase/aminodeoxychorismate synthase-like glutamine amidotransferase
MILMIDNYDSFTYNLVQYLGQLGQEVVTHRNDRIDLDAVRKLRPDHIVISPGPCTPREAGICVDLILSEGGRTPILGVCLGHQCIGAAYGGTIVRAARLMHGKTSLMYHDGKGLFRGLDNPFVGGRYHSLVIQREDLPACLEISARTEDEEIMAVRHRMYPVEGIQFHPESILTPDGMKILKNFLDGA